MVCYLLEKVTLSQGGGVLLNIYRVTVFRELSWTHHCICTTCLGAKLPRWLDVSGQGGPSLAGEDVKLWRWGEETGRAVHKHAQLQWHRRRGTTSLLTPHTDMCCSLLWRGSCSWRKGIPVIISVHPQWRSVPPLSPVPAACRMSILIFSSITSQPRT